MSNNQYGINKGIYNSFNAANITNIDRNNVSTNIGGVTFSCTGPIHNCYNVGNITDEGGSAGITTRGRGNIRNCFNTGTIYTTKGLYISGIVSEFAGQNYHDDNIENCYNLGNITGRGAIGGIVEVKQSNGNINNCYNSGKINLSDIELKLSNRVGAIAGGIWGENTKIENCKYLTGSANYGIGENLDSKYSIQATDTLPTILEVVNKDNVFIQDAGDAHPVFYWQRHPDILRDKSIN